jgi:hypothetical protein
LVLHSQKLPVKKETRPKSNRNESRKKVPELLLHLNQNQIETDTKKRKSLIHKGNGFDAVTVSM